MGREPCQHLDQLGALNERTVLVHAIWLDDREIDTVAERGARIAHCPASNMFLGDGVTPVRRYLERGVTVGLGTDGGCTNSRHSVYDECRSAVLLQKVDALDGAAMDAETAFALGTAHGGRLLGLSVGELKPGFAADFSVLDLDDMSLLPAHNLAKNIVHSMTERAVQAVYVQGRERVRQGRVLGLDHQALSRELHSLAERWRR